MFTIHLKSEWNEMERERKRKRHTIREREREREGVQKKKGSVDLMNENTHTEECVAAWPSERISPHTGVEAAANK